MSTKIEINDYAIPSLLKLLTNANKDTDACSITYFGTHAIQDADFAVIIVKGREQTKLVSTLLENAKLYTPGKPIAEDAAHAKATK